VFKTRADVRLQFASSFLRIPGLDDLRHLPPIAGRALGRVSYACFQQPRHARIDRKCTTESPVSVSRR
jgi:hypothetical protein